MTIRQREIGDVVVLDIDGKIMGGVDSELFQETIQSLIDSGKRKVVVNLENVKWINSTGLGVLIAGYSALQKSGGRLKLLQVSERVEGLLNITKLSTIFESYQGEDEAVESFV
ncbi:MAG: STAS domain-containing protein [Candidatus Latescibacterota bacterium]|nr:MAG: STAS domain-containing protein [Candidatus Latescibacterota bacterium]